LKGLSLEATCLNQHVFVLLFNTGFTLIDFGYVGGVCVVVYMRVSTALGEENFGLKTGTV
jgi:hypothetical protein